MHKNMLSPVFVQPWWLDIVCGPNHWSVVLKKNASNQIEAFWPIPIAKYPVLNIARQPPLTPYLGIHQSPFTSPKNFQFHSFPNQTLVNYFIDQFNKLNLTYFNQYFPNEFLNWEDFYRNKFNQETYYRYVIDLRQPLDTIFNNFDTKVKRRIDKFKSNHSIGEGLNSDLLYDLVQDSHHNSNAELPIAKSYFNILIESAMQHTPSKVFYAKNTEGHSGEIMAACFILIDHDTSYFLVHGVNQKYRSTGVVSALVWHSIQYAKSLTKEFDFAGSMIKPISTFMQNFGGNLRPYLRLYYDRNSITKIMRLLIH